MITLSQIVAVFAFGVATVLMGILFYLAYLACKMHQEDRHEQRHHEDNDMFPGGGPV